MKAYPYLFQNTRIGSMNVPNRVIMAPLTRLRSELPGDIPTDLMAEYYAQRASAGFIITEATQVSAKATKAHPAYTAMPKSARGPRLPKRYTPKAAA